MNMLTLLNNTCNQALREAAYMAAARYIVAAKCGIRCSAPAISVIPDAASKIVQFGGNEVDLTASPETWTYAFGIAMITTLMAVSMACGLGRLDTNGYEIGEEEDHLAYKRWTRMHSISNEDWKTFYGLLDAVCTGDLPRHSVGLSSEAARYFRYQSRRKMESFLSGRATAMMVLNRTSIRLMATALLEGKTLTQESADQIISEAERMEERGSREVAA